jgi:hypothetical protein
MERPDWTFVGILLLKKFERFDLAWLAEVGVSQQMSLSTVVCAMQARI